MESIKITSKSGNLYVDSNETTTDIYINETTQTPVGSVLIFSGITAPAGWLLCDGSEISKTTYSRLYSVVQNLYGDAIDSSNNFVLPNLQERIPVGKNNSSSIGDLGGHNNVTLDITQLPSHSHSGTVDASGSHTHTGTVDASGSHTHTGTTDSNGSHSHGVTDPGHTHRQVTNQDDYNGGGGNPPSFMGDGGYSNPQVYWDNIQSSTTGISINTNGSHTHTFTSNTNGSHTHTFTSNSNGTHAHTFTTSSVGGGSQIDIRNKYIVMNYIIRY